mmetsp:Transcript_42717/g.107420  ORF Transcript_42717/g.107420 Transcript_42717/m.107420 type:complete len:233 (-) Transcript_42717:163-861(-)
MHRPVRRHLLEPLVPCVAEQVDQLPGSRPLAACRSSRRHPSRHPGHLLGDLAEHPSRLAFPGHHRCRFPLLVAADASASKYQDRNAVALCNVLLRYLLGLHLPAVLPRERHGPRRHGRRHRRERADAAPHPGLWRPLRQRPAAGLRRHRSAGAAGLVPQEARPLEQAFVEGRLLRPRVGGLLFRSLRNHRRALHHEDGSAGVVVSGARDSRHDDGDRHLSQGGAPLVGGHTG